MSEHSVEMDAEERVADLHSSGEIDEEKLTGVESEVRNDDTNTRETPNLEPARTSEEPVKLLFKKPLGLVVGPRRGKVAGKLRVAEPMTPGDSPVTASEDETSTSEDFSTTSDEDADVGVKVVKTAQNETVKFKSSPAQKLAENSVPIPYKEPAWGGHPKSGYSLEMLKSGRVVEHVDLGSRSRTVIGRLPNCDVVLLHPTVSRHHAVLQYRAEGDATGDSPAGFYLYDLDSTHGTFLNKNRVKPNMYIKLHVGHVLRLGCSTRLLVLLGPSEDAEPESELSVTEIRQQRQNEVLRRQLDKLRGLGTGEGGEEEDEGISWGMGEDAEEETDLSVNPFASTNNEELYLDDPKKTLRGWFEREGQELVYDVEEKGVAQFLCRVELPVDAARGGVVVAEAAVKGKKKEAVVQCALEACRILDRYGLLRQATHESRKRKAKDWEAEDFYDSDEDTFLDRTGHVEEKRKQRMKQAGQQEVLTHAVLVEKHKALLVELHEAEERLHEATAKHDAAKKQARGGEGGGEDEDELDAFMNSLSTAAHTDKMQVSKLKSTVAVLRAEESRLRGLVNLARPANLPELKPRDTGPSAAASERAHKMSAILGKTRQLVKNKLRNRPVAATATGEGDETKKKKKSEDLEEIEEDEEEVGENRGEVVSVEGETEKVDERAKDVTLKGRTETRENKTVEDVRLEGEGGGREVEVEKEVLPWKGRGGKVDREEVPEEEEEDDEDGEGAAAEVLDRKAKKRQKKNRKRMQQRTAKLNKRLNAIEAADPDFSDWTPPEGQTGDGKTSLNEKLGY